MRGADGLAGATVGGDPWPFRVGPCADLRELFRVPTFRRAAGSGSAGAAGDLSGRLRQDGVAERDVSTMLWSSHQRVVHTHGTADFVEGRLSNGAGAGNSGVQHVRHYRGVAGEFCSASAMCREVLVDGVGGHSLQL